MGIRRSIRQVANSSSDIIAQRHQSKVAVYLKLDSEIVEWFREAGPGYQARINEVLKRFVREVKAEDSGSSVLETAQSLFEKYYERCFWHMRRDLIVTEASLPGIIKSLRMYGGREGFQDANKLCR